MEVNSYRSGFLAGIQFANQPHITEKQIQSVCHLGTDPYQTGFANGVKHVAEFSDDAFTSDSDRD